MIMERHVAIIIVILGDFSFPGGQAGSGRREAPFAAGNSVFREQGSAGAGG
jgi:hypothetical protein